MALPVGSDPNLSMTEDVCIKVEPDSVHDIVSNQSKDAAETVLVINRRSLCGYNGEERCYGEGNKIKMEPKMYNCDSQTEHFVKDELYLTSEIIIKDECIEEDLSNETTTTIQLSKVSKKTPKKKQSNECRFCGKVFSRRNILKIHKRTHRTLKPFDCSICQKRLNTKSALQSHLLTHSDKKQFKCKICDKPFKCYRSSILHPLTHTGEKPFECTTCGKCFSGKTNMRVHSLLYCQRHKCKVCKERFTDKKLLRRHMFMHSGVKLFKCDHCKKQFTEESNLRSHLVMHSKPKQFE